MSAKETLKEYLTNLLESSHKFDACMQSLDIHCYLFLELSLPHTLICDTIECLFNEYQPSSSATSYYIHYQNRYKLFLLLSHIISNTHHKHNKSTLNNHESTSINSECHKLRNLILPKLHSLIFNKVFPCKSAVQSQCDGIKKIIETWSNQNAFEMKTFMLKNIVKDLQNTSSLYILNENEYEEPPNLDSLLKDKANNTPSYIELPATFNQNMNMNRRYTNNNEYFAGSRSQTRGRERNTYNTYSYRGGYDRNYRSQRNNNSSNNNNTRYESGYNEHHEHHAYSNNKNNEYYAKQASVQNNAIQTRSRTRSRSRSRSKGKEERSNAVDNNNEKERKRKKEFEERERKKEYKQICAQSVIAGVNLYPDIKEFRDEDKMWRLQCENKRKEQRKQRVHLSLKVAGENMDDQFEKFFNEGMKRWDLVKTSCLDKRIWEYKMNLNYNDCCSNYGFGNSQIRQSPFFSKK